jgi:hypothetical protein
MNTTELGYNVVYRGVDGRAYSLWTINGTAGWDDLSSAVSGAPLPAADPTGDPTAFYNAQDGPTT